MNLGNNNPMDIDLSSVDVSRPLLKGNLPYDFKIVKAEIKPNANGTTKRLEVELATTAPAESVNGEQLQPGVRVFHGVNLSPSGKSTWEIVTRGVAELIQSLPGGIPGAKIGNADAWHKQLEGKNLRARVIFKPEEQGKDGKSYRAKNEISTFVKAA